MSIQLSSVTPTDVERATGIFQRMPSIPRLFRESIVTEKIDGTNASIFIDDHYVQAASRSRWITPSDDNFGFAKWVDQYKWQLREVLGEGHHFGEWFGSGIQRGYGLDEKRFALFNVSRWYDAQNAWAFSEEEQDKQGGTLYMIPGLYVVPVLGRGIFDTDQIREIAGKLQDNGSIAVPGYDKPEGIVVFHSAANALFKYTFDKNDGHKGGDK